MIVVLSRQSSICARISQNVLNFKKKKKVFIVINLLVVFQLTGAGRIIKEGY